jgi:hypothetical protein
MQRIGAGPKRFLAFCGLAPQIGHEQFSFTMAGDFRPRVRMQMKVYTDQSHWILQRRHQCTNRLAIRDPRRPQDPQ